MFFFILQIFLFQAIIIGISECGLLRQPKVYNAVITTDDNLQPSRAFPVVQPVLETGYGGYPFSYLGGYPQFHGNYDFSQFYNKFNQQPQQQPEQPLEQQPEEPNQEEPKDKKTQIPLNDHGLPPSLIPLPTYGNQHHGQQRPISLQPYPFSSYPLTYDPFGGYNQNPYLPPFNGYYPSPVPPQSPEQEKKTEEEKKEDKKDEPEVEKDQKPEETTQKKIDESPEQDVKNITKKDKNIPDVPPPPIPSGGNNNE